MSRFNGLCAVLSSPAGPLASFARQVCFSPRTPLNHPRTPSRAARVVRQAKLHSRPKAGGRQPCGWARPPGAQARSAVDFCLPVEIIEGKKKMAYKSMPCKPPPGNSYCRGCGSLDCRGCGSRLPKIGSGLPIFGVDRVASNRQPASEFWKWAADVETWTAGKSQSRALGAN